MTFTQTIKGSKKREVGFKCPNDYCNRVLKRSTWADESGEHAYACCGCGALLLLTINNGLATISWVNKNSMPQARKCFVCNMHIPLGEGKVYRGFNVHKRKLNGKPSCFEQIQGKSVKELLSAAVARQKTTL